MWSARWTRPQTQCKHRSTLSALRPAQYDRESSRFQRQHSWLFLIYRKTCLMNKSIKQNKTKQHNTTQHNTTQHNTTQHNTTQHNTTQHNTTQHNTTQHKTKQNKTKQNKTNNFTLSGRTERGLVRLFCATSVLVARSCVRFFFLDSVADLARSLEHQDTYRVFSGLQQASDGSTNRACLFKNGCHPLTHRSKTQKVVALSSAEAQLHCIHQCAAENHLP